MDLDEIAVLSTIFSFYQKQILKRIQKWST